MNNKLQIDLISFLRNYYGISSNDLKMNRLTHEDIQILFPFIKRSSFDYVEDHYDECYKGKIVLVYDSKNKVIPYINPLIDDISFNNLIDNNYDDVILDVDLTGIEELSIEELLNLRKKLRYLHRSKEVRKVTDLIRSSKDKKTQAYQKRKERLRNGDDRSDKY